MFSEHFEQPEQPNEFAKTSLKFIDFERVDTDYTPFSFVLYGLKGKQTILVEDPQNKTMTEVSSDRIQDYLTIQPMQLDWAKTAMGTYMNIQDGTTNEIVPISNDFQYAWVSFDYAVDLKYVGELPEIDTPTFQLTREMTKKQLSWLVELQIKALMPIWPIWAKLERSSYEEKYTLRKVYMKVKDQFYRFPFGNISGDDGVCMGSGNGMKFASPKNIFLHWITTTFNRDYTPQMKAFKFKSRFKTNSDSFIPVTYNLDHIAHMINAENYDKLNSIDFLYYLANIEEHEAVNVMKLFVKLPKQKWEGLR